MADFQYHNEALRKARVLQRKSAAQAAMSGQNGNQQNQFADPDTGIGSSGSAYRAPVYSGLQTPQDIRLTPEFNAQEIIQSLERVEPRGQAGTPTGGRPASRPPSYPSPAVTPMLDNLSGACISPSPTPPLSDTRAHTFQDVMGDHEDFQDLFDTSLDWKY